MTETEAKEKECRVAIGAFVPMAAQGAIAIHAQTTINVGYGKCIGQKCMAWRWAPAPDYSSGYCGLAGAP